MEKDIDPKAYLIEILDFYKQKLLNGGCTMEEIRNVTKVLQENVDVNGTISDFAQFYGVPETTVRTNIFRKLLAKPKRVVLYPFQKFAKIVPRKWHDNR